MNELTDDIIFTLYLYIVIEIHFIFYVNTFTWTFIWLLKNSAKTMTGMK